MGAGESEQHVEQRQFHALRAHVDEMVACGASIDGRDPLRLTYAGVPHWVEQGMLISDLGATLEMEGFAHDAWH
ncbi:hypothetical protein [Stutzerimonas tarimensis]|uniref:Uncharacterized protein n=1 Tax=Stutzerimonas tarimensis TaxID=1507735 RepID=A0ABV7T294_9GAMM